MKTNNAKHDSDSHKPARQLAVQHLRFKYFSAFVIYTICLFLLAASLATNKWLVSRPIRVLRLASGQSNLTSANTTAVLISAITRNGRSQAPIQTGQNNAQFPAAAEQDSVTSWSLANENPILDLNVANGEKDTKFQGKIQFGLFSGTKVLNYGFGDRVSHFSVARTFFDEAKSAPVRMYEPITFRGWLLTVTGVVLALLFALVGSIFAIINFVIVPQGTVTGAVGLVGWNAAACVCSLIAMFAWLLEFSTRLRWSVLTPEEVQTGWTSEDRSRIGQSYYFVAAALVLHLVNLIILSVVHSQTWWSNSHDKAKDQTTSSISEGIIMLY